MQWDFPLSDRFRGKLWGFAEILTLKIRISLEDLFFGHTIRNHSDDRCNRNTQPSDTWHSTHL